MRVERRRRTAAWAVVLAVASSVPATAAEEGTVADTRAELDRTQEQLAAVEAELAELETRIDGVEAEVAPADLQLAVLSEELVEVGRRLEVAEQVAADAEATLADARARLAATDDALTAADDASRDARSALDDRAAMVWMRGPAAEAATLVRSLGNARDLHDVAVVARATAVQLDADQLVVATARRTAADAADARSARAAERAAIVDVAAAAYEARDEAEAIVAHQQQLVAEAERHRDQRRAALARIEDDAAARTALAGRLAAEAESLRAELLDQWLRDIQQLPVDGPPPPWADRLPTAGVPVAPAIDAAAAAAGIDGRLFAALVWTESAFQPRATSSAGAIGLAQLMPATAAGLGVDPWDPVANLYGGARYLRMQLDRFGRIDLALAAYNAGPGRVERAGRAVPDIVETQLYVLRVLDRWSRLQ